MLNGYGILSNLRFMQHRTTDVLFLMSICQDVVGSGFCLLLNHAKKCA